MSDRAPTQAIVVVVPARTPPSAERTQRQLSLGDQITLIWISEYSTHELDADQLTEVLIAETIPELDLHSALTVCVDHLLLEQLFTTLTGQPPPSPIRFHTGTCPLTDAARPWLAKIQALIASLEQEPVLPDAPWFQPDIEGWWIATGLLYAFTHNHSNLLPDTPEAPPIATLRPPDDRSIGPLLADRRHELGLSQSALADLLTQASGTPITQGRVSDYEHERHIPDEWLPHLSAVLRLPLDQLRRAAELARTHRRHLRH